MREKDSQNVGFIVLFYASIDQSNQSIVIWDDSPDFQLFPDFRLRRFSEFLKSAKCCLYTISVRKPRGPSCSRRGDQWGPVGTGGDRWGFLVSRNKLCHNTLAQQIGLMKTA